MCFHYDGFCDVFESSIRRAAKPHKCAGCEAEIPPGDYCLTISSLFEGAWDTSRLCGSCGLTRYRIHLHELDEGCRWSESWCPLDEVRNYCDDAEFELSSAEDGRKWLEWERKNQRERA